MVFLLLQDFSFLLPPGYFLLGQAQEGRRQTVADDIAGTTFAPETDAPASYRLDNCLSGSQDIKVTFAGVIASREDQDLRSNSVMVPVQDTVGLTADYLLNAWKADASKVQSDLILEGGGL